MDWVGSTSTSLGAVSIVSEISVLMLSSIDPLHTSKQFSNFSKAKFYFSAMLSIKTSRIFLSLLYIPTIRPPLVKGGKRNFKILVKKRPGEDNKVTSEFGECI